jgi:hypothetical protein
MKPRNWLIGVSHIGMVLVLELWFSARSSSQGSSHSVNGLPLAAALLTVAAGYRVSGFVRWHETTISEDLRRWSVASMGRILSRGCPKGPIHFLILQFLCSAWQPFLRPDPHTEWPARAGAVKAGPPEKQKTRRP